MAIRRIDRLEPLEGLRLRVRFDDGVTVMYNVSKDVAAIPSYLPLITEPTLFFQAQLDESRTCVYWSDEIDLPSDVIYEHGIVDIDPERGYAILPAEWDDPEDDGLYDDLV